jgi:NAD(P)H-flavin reductase
MPGYLQNIGRIAAVTVADTNLTVPVPFLVRRRFRETVDTVTLEMASLQRQYRTDFLPGQFNMLYAFGIGEVPISISGDPARPETLMHTIRAVGAVSTALVRIKQGAMVGVRGAFGTGWPVHEACGKDVVLIGGGIGLAPLRPVIHHLLNNRKAFERVTLLCGARTPRDIIFQRQLERWQRRTDFQVEATVDAAGAAWQGHVGVVTRLVARLNSHPPNTIAMVCGPEVMMRFAVWELLQWGLAPDRIFLSLERNMKCGNGICGHCQFGPVFVCTEGPVVSYERIAPWFHRREV